MDFVLAACTLSSALLSLPTAFGGLRTKPCAFVDEVYFTWFDFQGATVDLDVEPLGRGAAEVFQDAVHRLRDVVRHRLVQLHPAVHHNAAVPEVEDFELLKSSQIGLEIRQKLWGRRSHFSPQRK